MSELYQHEKNLVSRLVMGDRHAFEVIYRTYAPTLINYAQKNLATKEDCEGIVQETFEWLWAKHDTLHHITSLRGYLFKMVRYKIIDHIRRLKVRKRYETHYLLFVAGQSGLTPSSLNSPDVQLLIDKSVSHLPERCQKAFRLRFDDNLPYKDIAFHMQISTKTVEKHISAALQHLRSAYRNEISSG
jgi:RNA polymerase sigma-70 factor (ECF subfamily)